VSPQDQKLDFTYTQ